MLRWGSRYCAEVTVSRAFLQRYLLEEDPAASHPGGSGACRVPAQLDTAAAALADSTLAERGC